MDRIVISASRRTDIPAFYLDWFLAGLRQGRFMVENPFNGTRRLVAAHPQQVQAIVFWSKDYSRLIERAPELAAYRLHFNFTLNSPSPLEPRLPALKARLAQFRALADRFGAAAIAWRFDPIVFWEEDGRFYNNLGRFEQILEAAAAAGVARLVISFMDRYAKAERRAARLRPGLRFHYPSLDEMVDTAIPLAEAARRAGLKVVACCEPKLIEATPPGLIGRSSCVDGALLTRLYGPGAPLAADRGQRRGAGCGCTQSVDVGSYSAQPCPHGCLYCYANPAPRRR